MSSLNDIRVTEVCEAILVYSERGRALDIKDRFSYGLSFCKSGEIVYTHKGQRIVSTSDVAVLLPMGESYHLDGSKTGEFPLINFFAERQDIHDFLVFPVHNLEGYLHDFETLRELLLHGREPLRAMSVFYAMLAKLAMESATDKDTLAPILRHLESHYHDPLLSNAQLAAQGGISEVYMRQLFRERLHTSPKQYVTELRMQKAKQLLTESSKTVGEIAAGCGFTAIYHFSAAFRATTGQTPTAYRRAHRKTLL